jgi:hypothetical protein
MKHWRRLQSRPAMAVTRVRTLVSPPGNAEIPTMFGRQKCINDHTVVLWLFSARSELFSSLYLRLRLQVA